MESAKLVQILLSIKSWMQARERLIVPVPLVLFALYYGVSGFLKVNSFTLGKDDTAIWETALWQAGQLRNPITYAFPSQITYPFIAVHFMPIGFAYGLIWRFFPSLYTTVTVYIVSFVAAGVLIYLAARRLTGQVAIALGLLIIYLVVYTPPLTQAYFEDWAAPYVAAGLYLTVRRRWGWATLAWAMAMMFKEYIGLAVAVLGMVVLVKNWRGRRGGAAFAAINLDDSFPSNLRYGITWTLLGVGWFSVSFFVLMKSAQQMWANMFMFRELGNSDTAVALALFSNPPVLLGRVFSPSGIQYLIALFVPLAFLSIVGIEYAAPVLPIIGLNFLPSWNMGVGSINSHYSTLFEPFLLVGAAWGVVRASGWLSVHPAALRRTITALVIAIAGLSTMLGLRAQVYYLRESLLYASALAPHTLDVGSILRMVPDDASVAASEALLPVLAHRQVVVHLDNIGHVSPQYIVCDPFYETDLPDVRERGINMGLPMLSAAPSQFYDSAQWMARPLIGCGWSQYEQIGRRGSVALYRRIP